MWNILDIHSTHLHSEHLKWVFAVAREAGQGCEARVIDCAQFSLTRVQSHNLTPAVFPIYLLVSTGDAHPILSCHHLKFPHATPDLLR